MLTIKESALVLAKINAHHGNMQLDQLTVQTFHEELRPDATVGECFEAVRRWYAANSQGRWMGSGDVNAEIGRMRNERKPSEAQIGREAEALGLDTDQAWAYRRQRMLGRGESEARQLAVASQPLALPPAKPKRHRSGMGFIGSRQPAGAGTIGLEAIIGRRTS